MVTPTTTEQQLLDCPSQAPSTSDLPLSTLDRGTGATFTVRKISSGVGVERVFPLHAPTVTGIEVVRRGRVRRAKLYYLRGLRGKAARIKEKRTN